MAQTWGSGVSLSHGATAKPHLGDGGRVLKALGHVARRWSTARAARWTIAARGPGRVTTLMQAGIKGLRFQVSVLGFEIQGLGFRL